MQSKRSYAQLALFNKGVSMTRFSGVILGTSLVVLSGCSSLQERQTANGNFDYLDSAESVAYKVPVDVQSPRQNKDYYIPELGEKAPRDLLGDKLTVVSPALVLPLVTGSHVEEGLKEATVWFDQVDDSQPLDTTIWNSLIAYLEEQGIGVISFDKSAQKLITDWMIIEQEEDKPWYNRTTTERSIGRRFEFTLEMKPHGRTAALKAELKDYLETIGDEVIADLSFEQERRNEVSVLNQVIGHYQQQIRLADIKRIRQIRTGLPMELGFDDDGAPAFVVDGEYDVVWPRLLLVLRKLGFNVKDLDKSNGLLFVNYGTLDNSWWDKLWSKNENALRLDKDAYRIQVESTGPKTTSITMLDKDNNPFEANKLADIFKPFESTMSKDDLDL
jgi:outer membrane protein assembly factor BamC